MSVIGNMKASMELNRYKAKCSELEDELCEMRAELESQRAQNVEISKIANVYMDLADNGDKTDYIKTLKVCESIISYIDNEIDTYSQEGDAAKEWVASRVRAFASSIEKQHFDVILDGSDIADKKEKSRNAL